MSVRIDGNFWSNSFRTLFIPQINYFCNTIIQRVLPSFETIGDEADEIADAEYKRLAELPLAVNLDWMDSVDAAEYAFEKGLDYVEAMNAVEQTMINLALVALYHIFEQQLLFFHRRQILHPYEENDLKKIKISELKGRLHTRGVDISLFQSWPKIEELRLISNVVKHAEGRSADELRSVRPDLFVPSALKDEPWSKLATGLSVYSPLTGEDIYLTVEDLQLYQSILVSFWQELGETIKNL